jgi:hypothetical protein
MQRRLGKMRVMTKRRLLRWSLLLVIFAAFAVWLEPTRVVWGWLRGEAFYQGRPTSWWRAELNRWERQLWGGGPNILPAEKWVRRKTGFETWFDRIRGVADQHEDAAPQWLRGDPAAEAVLRSLAHDELEAVKNNARAGLSALHIWDWVEKSGDGTMP